MERKNVVVLCMSPEGIHVGAATCSDVTAARQFERKKENKKDFEMLSHGWSGKGLQHMLGATKRAFTFFHIFGNSDNRLRFPLNILKLGLLPEIPLKSTEI